MSERRAHPPGTIVLAQVPYTDGVTSKVRPALLIAAQQSDDLEGLVILVPITSSERRLLELQPGDLVLHPSSDIHLDKPSVAQGHRPFTSQMRYLGKGLGSIGDDQLEKVRRDITDFINAEKPRTLKEGPRRD